MKRIMTATTMAVLLTACAGDEMVHKFNDESYLKATSLPAMEIPADLEETTYIEAYYPAPAGQYPDPNKTPISAEPPEMGDLLKTQKKAQPKPAQTVEIDPK